MVNQKHKFDLNLTPWQSRLVKDFIDLDVIVDSITINPGVIQCPASYKIPVEGLSRRDWVLYLTDEQMKIVQKEFGLKSPISAINITEGQIKRGDVTFKERTFKLVLTKWQLRMVKDFVKIRKRFREIVFKPGVIQCPASYKIPVEGLSKLDWVLYLTDEQMIIIQKEFGLKSPISGINITEGQINRNEVVFQ